MRLIKSSQQTNPWQHNMGYQNQNLYTVTTQDRPQFTFQFNIRHRDFNLKGQPQSSPKNKIDIECETANRTNAVIVHQKKAMSNCVKHRIQFKDSRDGA